MASPRCRYRTWPRIVSDLRRSSIGQAARRYRSRTLSNNRSHALVIVPHGANDPDALDPNHRYNFSAALVEEDDVALLERRRGEVDLLILPSCRGHELHGSLSSPGSTISQLPYAADQATAARRAAQRLR